MMVSNIKRNDNDDIISLKVVCEQCGKRFSLNKEEINKKFIDCGHTEDDYGVLLTYEKHPFSCECGNIHNGYKTDFEKLSSGYQIPVKEWEDEVKNMSKQKIINSQPSSQTNIPKCPTCGSTNVEKISITKKATGGILFGLFSSDVRKTMHCKNCGYKW